ncbi:hypothetical protein BDY19DRAFT_244936 [Irpex rosettiformis]|uniref:Uncharacterized protein n=1 Tax=Irpex rosettiformis TaxID=378272 RepID=A0ACB8TZ67_9APHY|nr:hypothetical protein BDY19DRAFT_244936 [Irpex rosettiformis]
MVATAREQPIVDNDNMNYNPSANADYDQAAFDDSKDFESTQTVGARNADNQPTSTNFTQEDRETERSEMTGQIPRSEVNDLLKSATQEEKGMSGRTRGKKNDAWKQEKELDKAYTDTGIIGSDEISKDEGY